MYYLVLHPVRMRIIQALLCGELTTQEIARAMPDVPPATLYRHLNRLAEGSIVSVVAERVMDAFQRYLDQESIDFKADGVSYGQATVYLNDDELRQLSAEYVAMMQRAMALPPGPGRRRRIVSSIVVPEPMPDTKGELE